MAWVDWKFLKDRYKHADVTKAGYPPKKPKTPKKEKGKGSK